MIKPLLDRVVITQDKPEDISKGGIIIAESAKEKVLRGTVVAIGDGKEDEPMTVSIGDKIIYDKFAGLEIEVEGEKYLMMKETEILAIL